MKEHPIMFCDQCVSLILQGRKTQTRRIVKPKTKKPYGDAGDTLWVQEAFLDYVDPVTGKTEVVYRADSFNRSDELAESYRKIRWKPSLFMRKDFSRIRLKVTSIKTQTLSQMTDSDARKEGVRDMKAFRELWKQIHGEWKPEIKVMVVTFEYSGLD